MTCKRHKNMIDDTLSDWLRIVWGFVSGTFMAIIGYFLPVKNIVHLVILFFLLDVIFGYWAARKVRGESFSARIIWQTTMPRMIISLVLIMGAYMWDDVFQQEMVCTYKVIGWFICGVLLANIIQNGYRITKWDMFLRLGQYFKIKIKDKINIETNPKGANNENN
jgi:hypothetical protein